MQLDTNTVTVILGLLLALSEALSLIPAVKANGIFQLVVTLLKTFAGRCVAMLAFVLMVGGLSACVTINNSALSGEKNAVKTDADATPTTNVSTSASIPLK